MEKNYTLTITAAGWEHGVDYEQTNETTGTTSPGWDRYGMAEWINDGKDVNDLSQIIENADDRDVKFTFTITDELGEITFEEEMWESEAAKIAMREV